MSKKPKKAKHTTEIPIILRINYVICDRDHLHIELFGEDDDSPIAEIVFDDIDEMCMHEKHLRAAINEICEGATK